VTGYVHLQANSIPAGVVPGAAVTQGQRIGIVGDTGNAKGLSAHLHFRIIENGKLIDPEKHLTDPSVKASWPISPLQ
jgi:murein DD-endopeptidase MepM/ murein hydrolase activator NlpD